MRDRKVNAETEIKNLALRISLDKASSSSEIPQQSCRRIDNYPALSKASPAFCKMRRSSPEIRSVLHNLPNNSTILLFTPVVQACRGEPASEMVDPFEHIGRVFASYKRCIRHVPYVPGIGFTSTHDAFLGQADAIIAVVCGPESWKTERSGTQISALEHAKGALVKQIQFAEHAYGALESKAFNGANEPPLILVQFGDTSADWWPDVDIFDTVCDSAFCDVKSTQEIAKMIFKYSIQSPE